MVKSTGTKVENDKRTERQRALKIAYNFEFFVCLFVEWDVQNIHSNDDVMVAATKTTTLLSTSTTNTTTDVVAVVAAAVTEAKAKTAVGNVRNPY